MATAVSRVLEETVTLTRPFITIKTSLLLNALCLSATGEDTLGGRLFGLLRTLQWAALAQSMASDVSFA